MINKDLDHINQEDLQNLISEAITEGKTIDYKVQLPGETDVDKKEFLADISSFANTNGGDLIFGIAEDGGLPENLIGIKLPDVDSVVLKYENMIRDGMEPRVNVLTRCINLSTGKCILIFRVQKSRIGPHRVTYKGHDRFYSRSSAGKYPLDTSELRQAFSATQTLNERISVFKAERIAQIYSNNMPLPFIGTAKVVLHIIPVEAFNHKYNFDTQAVKEMGPQLPPICTSGWSNRINLEGLLTYVYKNSNKSDSYVQLYRNGIIEAVDGAILQPSSDNGIQRNVIRMNLLENKLQASYVKYIALLKSVNVTPPLVIYLTLVGIDGYEMGATNFEDHYKIDRDILSLPEAYVENVETSASAVLKPMFDLIWNACGYEKSPNFDDNGVWSSR